MEGEPSRHVAPIREAMAALGFETTIQRVDYEFQTGGHDMLQITRRD